MKRKQEKAGEAGEAGEARGRPELVAPAGSAEAGFAALRYGADAIYAGLKRFSARADAENLDLDELEELVARAHDLTPRRRVYVALNTLVLQDELADLVDALAALDEIGVDAIVVQDLGVCRVVRRHFPPAGGFPRLRLHASTQMAAHSRAGVETLASLGFARAVLARELTLEEVRDCASVPGIEVEVFVHGALCYSYSGMCLFSSHVLGRSGNRGRCAQPCRVAFRAGGAPPRPGLRRAEAASAAQAGGPGPDAETCFPFAMRDLALPNHVERLRAAGAAALKIEGRKRSALYVAAVTDYYRRLIDGAIPPGRGVAPGERAALEEDIRTIFGRRWTGYHIEGAGQVEMRETDVTGHRGALIGEVEAVVVPPGEKRAFLRFTTSRRLEVRDGLQVDAPGLDRPFGFSIERMRVSVKSRRRRWKEAYEAPAGSPVEVELPDEYPLTPAGAAVHCSSSQEVKQRYRTERPRPGRFRVRRPIEVVVELGPDTLAAAATLLREDSIEARAEIAGEFDPAKDPAKTEAAARGAFEKLGETRFDLASFELRNPDGLFAPVSLFNRLRRELTAELEAKLREHLSRRTEDVKREVLLPPGRGVPAPRAAPRPARGGIRWSVKTDRTSHLAAFDADDWRACDEVIVDVSREGLPPGRGVAELLEGLERIVSAVGRDAVRLALPAITRAREEAELRDPPAGGERIARLREKGFSKWEVANVSGWAYLGARVPEPAHPALSASTRLDLATDWPVYVTNRQAALEVLEAGAGRFTLSPEDGLANMRPLLAEFGERATVVVHQDTPLFISEACAHAGLAGSCPGEDECPFESAELFSAFGDRVIALRDRREAGGSGCRTVVIHRDPYCISDRLEELARAGAVSLRCDFVWREYSPEEARDRWRLVRAGGTLPGARIANFERGLA